MSQDQECLKEVIIVVRSLITSTKPPVSLRSIERDYMNMEQTPIPFRSLGYRSALELLEKCCAFDFQKNGNEVFVSARPNPKSAHIASMVRLQKSNKRKPTCIQPQTAVAVPNNIQKQQALKSEQQELDGFRAELRQQLDLLRQQQKKQQQHEEQLKRIQTLLLKEQAQQKLQLKQKQANIGEQIQKLKAQHKQGLQEQKRTIAKLQEDCRQLKLQLKKKDNQHQQQCEKKATEAKAKKDQKQLQQANVKALTQEKLIGLNEGKKKKKKAATRATEELITPPESPENAASNKKTASSKPSNQQNFNVQQPLMPQQQKMQPMRSIANFQFDLAYDAISALKQYCVALGHAPPEYEYYGTMCKVRIGKRVFTSYPQDHPDEATAKQRTSEVAVERLQWYERRKQLYVPSPSPPCQLKDRSAEDLLHITKGMKNRALLIIKNLNLLEMEILNRWPASCGKKQTTETPQPTFLFTPEPTTPLFTTKQAPVISKETAPSTKPDSDPKEKTRNRLDKPMSISTTTAQSPNKPSHGFYFDIFSYFFFFCCHFIIYLSR